MRKTKRNLLFICMLFLLSITGSGQNIGGGSTADPMAVKKIFAGLESKLSSEKSRPAPRSTRKPSTKSAPQNTNLKIPAANVQKPNSVTPAAPVDENALLFEPTSDSGLYDEIGKFPGDSAQIEYLRRMYGESKDYFEKYPKFPGRENDFAYAVTFSFAHLLSVYHDSPLPPPVAMESIYSKIRELMLENSKNLTLTNRDKFQLSERFVLGAYSVKIEMTEIKKSGDQTLIKEFRERAGNLFRQQYDLNPDNYWFDKTGLVSKSALKPVKKNNK